MKTASHTAHPSVREVRKQSEVQYSIKYVQSPTRSFVVNPKEGEINYEEAYKGNFHKFYNKVASQPIVKYKM